MAKILIKKKTNSKGSIKRQVGLAEKVKLAAKTNQSETNFPLFRAGDTLRVHVKIKEGDKERIQPYEGVCIKIGNHPGGKSFNVRKMSHGVGVERIFLYTSPKVSKIEILQQGKVRRAKLYYIRDLEGRAARIERLVDNTPKADKTSK